MITSRRRIRYCTRCVMPETRPDLSLDSEGVCDACRSNHLKDSIDWDARRAELERLMNEHRNQDGVNYDCIIPSSGGKDSHFQAYFVKHVLGLNPLCVTWTPCNQTALGRKNLENLKRMGVDYIEVTGNPVVIRKLVRLGFELIGDCCWPEHVGIFTVPFQIAVKYRVPLLVWGEKGQFEYGGPASARQVVTMNRRWMEEFGGLRGLRVEDAMTLTGATPRDLICFQYPTDDELMAVGVKGIFLGQFLRWDARRQLEIIRRYGFSVNEDGPQEGTYTNYENLDCKYVGIHDYLMFCKYGFGRATSHACIDIRNGRLDRAEAMRLVRQFDGRVPRKYLDEFLRELDLTEADFFRICDAFTNKSVFLTDADGKPVRDANGDLTKLNWDNDDAAIDPARTIVTRPGGLDRRSSAPPAHADVTIVDYGMGNLRSVAKAFETLGYKPVVTSRPADVEVADRIVLPGVGAFGDAMRQLRERQLVDVLRERVIERGVPFLGICLGMQVLAEIGLENGRHTGLGWVAGETLPVEPTDPALKVPHIGWNDVEPSEDSRLLRSLPASPVFYFVHGYHLVPSDKSVVHGVVDYGGRMTAVLEREQLFATQFHPEKSQRAGLALLRNFMNA